MQEMADQKSTVFGRTSQGVLDGKTTREWRIAVDTERFP